MWCRHAMPNSFMCHTTKIRMPVDRHNTEVIYDAKILFEVVQSLLFWYLWEFLSVQYKSPAATLDLIGDFNHERIMSSEEQYPRQDSYSNLKYNCNNGTHLIVKGSCIWMKRQWQLFSRNTYVCSINSCTRGSLFSYGYSQH